ncbi:MAG: YIP1 family protein [Candidatus Aminicenantes bacterium]|nr:YIP1 family protein [Candidatus Aminicenantes bacterium]
MNFFNRFQGIFLSPQQIFNSISQKPVWVDALIFLLIAGALFSYLSAPYAQKDQVQLLKNNVKLQERLGEERFNQTIERLENPSKSSIFLRSVLLSPITMIIGFLFASLIIMVIGRFTSTEGNFIQILSAYLHANFIDKIFGNAIRLFLVFTKKSMMQTTTSLALFFPRLEFTSPAFIILSQFDFFQLWMFGILGFGISSILKIDLKRALFISYGFWALKSLFYIAITMISMQFLG